MMTNKYPGRCEICGRRVEPGDGILERVQEHSDAYEQATDTIRMRWALTHKVCPPLRPRIVPAEPVPDSTCPMCRDSGYNYRNMDGEYHSLCATHRRQQDALDS